MRGLAIWPALAQPGLISIFQALTDGQKVEIKEDEITKIRKFVGEAMPYAILARLAWIYGHSWKVEAYRSSGQESYRGLAAESETIAIGGLEQPGPGTLLHTLGYDPISAMQTLRTISLPVESTLAVVIDADERHSVGTVTISKPNAFTLSIQIVPSRWTVGLPHGSPGAFADLGSDQTRQETYAHVMVDIIIRADFDFPDSANEELEEHFAWINQLVDEIRRGWSWDTHAVSQEHQLLQSVQGDVLRVLMRMDEIAGD